jgi:hypothetical protein
MADPKPAALTPAAVRLRKLVLAFSLPASLAAVSWAWSSYMGPTDG